MNPSKVRDLAGRRRHICAELDRAGWPEPLWLETTEDDPGCGQARQAVEAGVGVVFVCGGDGTVMATLEALVGTDVAMCVLPSGTGNLLARNLGLPDDVAAGIRLATHGTRRRIDVGRADGHCFAVMAGVGFDARMIAGTDHGAKRRWGWPAYAVSALRELRAARMDVTIRLDDADEIRRRAHSVLVGNVGRLQGGVRLLPDAEPDDGSLDVAVLAPHGVGQWLWLATRLLFGRGGGRRVEVFRARRVEIRTATPQPREVDGDLIEPSDLTTVEVVPSALLLCVGGEAASGDLEEAA